MLYQDWFYNFNIFSVSWKYGNVPVDLICIQLLNVKTMFRVLMSFQHWINVILSEWGTKWYGQSHSEHHLWLTNCLSYTRYGCTRAILIALFCTFFDAFNIPVFWPILVMYFIILFVLTMKRQIKVGSNITNVYWTVNSVMPRCLSCGKWNCLVFFCQSFMINIIARCLPVGKWNRLMLANFNDEYFLLQWSTSLFLCFPAYDKI